MTIKYKIVTRSLVIFFLWNLYYVDDSFCIASISSSQKPSHASKKSPSKAHTKQSSSLSLTKTLPLSLTQKQISGTRTTGAGSRRIEKSIFHKRQTKPYQNPSDNRPKLYVELQESRLLFHVQNKDLLKTISMTFQQSSSSANHDIETQIIPSKDVAKSSSTNERVLIEGIYGVYLLPSGPHIVLIYDTEEVYTSTRENDKITNLKNEKVPLFELRKITKMEIVRVPYNGVEGIGAVPSLTVMQRKEEERQLRLLRASFREHALYYTPIYRHEMNPNSVSKFVHDDITHTVQRTFLLHAALSIQNNQTNQTNIIDEKLQNKTESSLDKESQKNILQSSRGNNFLWSTSDSRFFWNEDLIRPLLPPTSPSNAKYFTSSRELLLRFIIPCTSAFVGVQTCVPLNEAKSGNPSQNNTNYDLLLISRRSRYRAGTRFTMRGADATGSVANYAETEQIIILNNTEDEKVANINSEIYSHVQTRGSIPLRWSSPADVKTYAPRVRIGMDPLSQARALRRHLVEQLTLYSHSVPEILEYEKKKGQAKTAELVFCNLVDKQKDQGRLGRAFDTVLKAVLDIYKTEPIFSYGVEHIWYDFHAECKGGKWYKLKSLLEQVTPALDTHKYFSARGTKICSLQRGTVRTNCMDCLDRTNVVQSLFARYVIFHQLYNRYAKEKSSGRTLPLEFVVAYRKEPLSLPWKEGEKWHRALWADNADTISNLYAGTNALKGDFTRTGQRTKKGMLDDGVNSVTRYYLNNFADAMRQEGYDLMTGSTFFSFVKDDALGRNGSQDKKISKESQKNDRELHLRWLPGDLKSHTLSETIAPLNSGSLFDDKEREEIPSPLETAALAAIDHRAASDRPWWAMEEDEKIIAEGDIEKNLSGEVLRERISSTGRTGAISIIGAALLTLTAPITTATAIMLILGPGLFS